MKNTFISKAVEELLEKFFNNDHAPSWDCWDKHSFTQEEFEAFLTQKLEQQQELFKGNTKRIAYQQGYKEAEQRFLGMKSLQNEKIPHKGEFCGCHNSLVKSDYAKRNNLRGKIRAELRNKLKGGE